jgi:uncharacterized membrane protein YfcA
MLDAVLIGLIFILAGFVKGVAGFGLPTVSIALIALFRPIPEAIGLMLVPAFVTNIWQGLAGGQLRIVVPRIAVFLFCAVIATVAAAWHLSAVDSRLLAGLLGLSLLASASLALLAPNLPAPSRALERILAPPMGAISGVLAGFTGSFLVPAAPWLQAIRLPREQFVQAYGVCVLAINASLTLTLAGGGIMTREIGIMSLLSLPPALGGMFLGQKLRLHLPEARFRQVVQIFLWLIGAWLALRAFR